MFSVRFSYVLVSPRHPLKVTFLKSEAISLSTRYAELEGGGYRNAHPFEFSSKSPFLSLKNSLLSREHNEKIPRKVWSLQISISKKVFSRISSKFDRFEDQMLWKHNICVCVRFCFKKSPNIFLPNSYGKTLFINKRIAHVPVRV